MIVNFLYSPWVVSTFNEQRENNVKVNSAQDDDNTIKQVRLGDTWDRSSTPIFFKNITKTMIVNWKWK